MSTSAASKTTSGFNSLNIDLETFGFETNELNQGAIDALHTVFVDAFKNAATKAKKGSTLNVVVSDQPSRKERVSSVPHVDVTITKSAPKNTFGVRAWVGALNGDIILKNKIRDALENNGYERPNVTFFCKADAAVLA